MFRIVRGLLLLATFVVSLVVGVFAHLSTPALRRDAAVRVTQILDPLFVGKLTILSIGHVGLHGADGVSARVTDASGKTILEAHGVKARTSALGIVRSAVLGTGAIVIDLRDVSVASAEVDLDVDSEGNLEIANVFQPRTPSPPSAAPGRGVRFSIDHFELGHAWAHGAPVAGLPIDADVDTVRGGVLAAPPTIEVTVQAANLKTRGMLAGANALGVLQGRFTMPAPGGGEIGVTGQWKGTIAGVEETLSASLDGDACKVTLDAPQIPPTAIQTMWPASPIAEPGSLHLDASGTLSRIDLNLQATLGASKLTLAGPVTVSTSQHADLHLDVRALDLNALVPSAPPSSLAASGEVQVTRSAAGAIEGETKLEIERGTIAGEPTPSGSLHGTVKYDAKKGLRGDARISAREPGAPTALSVHISPTRTGAIQVAFDADVNAPKLNAIPRLRSALQGSTLLKAHGVIDLGKGEIEASINGEVDDLGQGGIVHAKHASVTVAATGTLSSPRLDVTLQGDVLDVAGYRFSLAHIEAHGPPRKVHLNVDLQGDDAPDVSAEADVSLLPTFSVSHVDATLARKDDKIHATVASVALSSAGIGLDGVVVTGMGGTLHASLQTSTDTLRVKADGEDLDVAALARVVRAQDHLVGCRLALDVDASLKRTSAEGRATADLSACSLGKVKDVTAHIDAAMNGRKITGTAKTDVPGVGDLQLTTSAIHIGGSAPVFNSFKRAWGKVKFDGHADLAKVADLFPSNTFPLDAVKGTVALSGQLERDTMDDMTPSFQLSVKTSCLSMVGPSKRKTDLDGASTITPSTWQIEGIDIALDSKVDGESGFADFALRLMDAKGELLDLDMKSATVPFANLLASPGKALETLESVQFSANVGIPKRKLSDLPATLGKFHGRGQLEGTVAVTGSVLKPLVDIDATLSGERGSSTGLALTTDFVLHGHYDGAHADATLTANMKKSRVLEARLAADASIPDILAGNDKWKASGSAHLTGLPIAGLSVLNDHEVQGTLSGDVTLDGLHDDAKAKVDLTVAGLKAGSVTYLSGKLRGSLGNGALDATLRFDQSDGFIDLRAHAGAKWGAALIPVLDSKQGLNCTLSANRFRAAILLPYVDNVFTELDARVNANVVAVLDPSTGRTRINGTIGVNEGRFELATVGGEFHDASMNLTFTPDGVVKIENVKASGISGKIEAAATVRLDNLTPVGANANIEIPSSAPLLLTVEGSQVGTLAGRMSIITKVSADKKTITANVEVPTLHVELPLTSSQDVQALGEIPNVQIGTKTAKGFTPERLDAARVQMAAPANQTIQINLNLGKDVEVKKGATLKVALAGKPSVTIKDTVQAGGQIRLLRGTIDVQGKSFDVENGTVTFVGDPTNPQVVVTAGWTGPDGTRVYADFVGPLKTGTVHLRSEPSLSQNEIVSLLLFGTSDANANQQANASSTAGAGIAGSAAAQPLNRALESYGLGGVTTRIDTSEQNARPEVEVQIARDISVQVAYVIGTPPPGQNPDTALLTLNWRFIRQWSLETTVGNEGTSIMDLIWQHRY